MLSDKIIEIDLTNNNPLISSFLQASLNFTKGYFFVYDNKTKNVRYGLPEIQYPAWSFHQCREVMADYYFYNENPITIGFYLPNVNIDKFNEFWEALEDKLGLKGNNKCSIFNTTMKGVFLVEVSPFWRENETRRQFFTLFLRCGAEYYKSSFEEALSNYGLLNSIRLAVDWFLDGNTIVKQEISNASNAHDKFAWNKRHVIVGRYGLVHTYKHLSKEQLSEKLTKN